LADASEIVTAVITKKKEKNEEEVEEEEEVMLYAQKKIDVSSDFYRCAISSAAPSESITITTAAVPTIFC
jgi:hypothetical protein